jgi:hypothetical protein
MNEEQRAVLEAVARLEESRGGPIDEYSVARAAGILTTDLSGQEYLLSQEREQIRRAFDELEESGMLRVDRTGYWRPRTTLAGRRALQSPQAPPPVVGRGAVPRDDVPPADRAGAADERRGAARAWPAWWPVPLRFGQDAGALPVLAAIGVVALLLVFVLAALAVRAIGGGGAPTPTTSAFAAATGTAANGAVAPPAGTVDFAATPMTTAALATAATPATPTPRPPTATRGPLPPTATPRSNAPIVIVANTDGEGAFLYATPNGERTQVALPEGTELEDIGPDEQDSLGRTWKHVRTDWGFEGWLLTDYIAQP